MSEASFPGGTSAYRPWCVNVTPMKAIMEHNYEGSGNEGDPYLIDWLPDDLENPLTWSSPTQWFQLCLIAFATLALTAGSSAYTGGAPELHEQFHVGEEVILLGISLYVLGFGAGPLVWSPLSDVYGRRTMYLFSFTMLTLWNAVGVASPNMASVLIFRFLSGFFGGVPLSSGGATVADVFPPAQRGVAISVFVSTAFLGPALGPICGGFLGQQAGWRWVEAFLAVFSGVVTITLILFCAETCAPVLLRRRATRLSLATGKSYRYRGDAKGTRPLRTLVTNALLSPWKFLLEPIVILLTLDISLIYGVVYLDFAAFPVVFGELRGWNRGDTGLTFLGIVVGVFLSLAFIIFVVNPRFIAKVKSQGGKIVPEDRLMAAVIGEVACLVGLIGFAATDNPSVHWSAPVIFGIPFGFGVVLIFLAVIGYLVDAYTVFAAPVLAANAFARAAFAAAFPLFTVPMYHNIGPNWAAAIPAFLLFACIPPTYLLMKYGAKVRARSKWSVRAGMEMKAMMAARGAGATRATAPPDEEAATKIPAMVPVSPNTGGHGSN